MASRKYNVYDARGLENWKKTILDGKLPNERRAPPLHESGAKVDERFYIRYCFCMTFTVRENMKLKRRWEYCIYKAT
jgi:hypothetical protein